MSPLLRTFTYPGHEQRTPAYACAGAARAGAGTRSAGRLNACRQAAARSELGPSKALARPSRAPCRPRAPDRACGRPPAAAAHPRPRPSPAGRASGRTGCEDGGPRGCRALTHSSRPPRRRSASRTCFRRPPAAALKCWAMRVCARGEGCERAPRRRGGGRGAAGGGRLGHRAAARAAPRRRHTCGARRPRGGRGALGVGAFEPRIRRRQFARPGLAARGIVWERGCQPGLGGRFARRPPQRKRARPTHGASSSGAATHRRHAGAPRMAAEPVPERG